jgi:hypothetical protein
VKDRKGFDMTYFGSTRAVDQASAHVLPRVFPAQDVTQPQILRIARAGTEILWI